jgi:SAM-dependent methyltransferase
VLEAADVPRPGELTYYDRIGEAGRRHAVAKPFSDDEAGLYLLRVGALFGLLPPPPARVLDCGCGTGWLSYLLARRGYDVVGVDVSAEAVELARAHPLFRDGGTPRFVVADAEALTFDAEFDAVVFFDALHHAVDERAAIAGAFRALRPGGVCVALEPGRGHARKSRAVDAAFDVTDKDMPPAVVCRIGRAVGFASCRALPAPQHLGRALYDGARAAGWRARLLSMRPVRHLVVQAIMLWQNRYCGIAILQKG